MSRKDKLVELASKSVGLIKEVMDGTEKENALIDVNYNECGDTIIFTLNNNKTVEYSLSEIGYIFKDDLDGFGIFSINDYKEIHSELRRIQMDTELL